MRRLWRPSERVSIQIDDRVKGLEQEVREQKATLVRRSPSRGRPMIGAGLSEVSYSSRASY
jgi:hypothetical protein